MFVSVHIVLKVYFSFNFIKIIQPSYFKITRTMYVINALWLRMRTI